MRQCLFSLFSLSFYNWHASVYHLWPPGSMRGLSCPLFVSFHYFSFQGIFNNHTSHIENRNYWKFSHKTLWNMFFSVQCFENIWVHNICAHGLVIIIVEQSTGDLRRKNMNCSVRGSFWCSFSLSLKKCEAIMKC